MAFTFGFYNSVNHDRRYDSVQISMIFDGIISDGIYATVGKAFVVKASEVENTVIVQPGRGWFDHTWNYNDADLPVISDQSEIILDRIDALVIDIKSNEEKRENGIIWVKGTPSSNPIRPTLINTKEHHQYPLCYVYRTANEEIIKQEDITNMVGTSECPFVTGVLDTINIDELLLQWKDQWDNFFEAQSSDMITTSNSWKAQWTAFYNQYTSEMNTTKDYWQNLWHSWYHSYTDSSAEEFSNWKNEQKAEYIAWLNSLQELLNQNVAAELANEILKIRKEIESLISFEDSLSDEFAIYKGLQDSSGIIISDSTGDEIKGQIMFVIK